MLNTKENINFIKRVITITCNNIQPCLGRKAIRNFKKILIPNLLLSGSKICEDCIFKSKRKKHSMTTILRVTES